MTLKEFELVKIAQASDDATANLAMKELREKYDATYGWCEDCDYAVVKEKECCMHPDNVKAREQEGDINLESF